METLQLQQANSVVRVADDEDNIIVAWRTNPCIVTLGDGSTETRVMNDSVYIEMEHIPALVEWLQALLEERRS